MCGLTGFLQLRAGAPAFDRMALVRSMADTIAHRGPDDHGEWTDPDVGYAVGFRRLAIIDLSSAGHQPMASQSGRYVIAFNGEVYNFDAIRSRLDSEGHRFVYRGHSDTEVMLAAIEVWGLEKAVREFVGMFAFALWDRQERVLHLVRDRLGVKPLYYGVSNGVLLFGSELKAFRQHPAFDGEVDRGALTVYLRHYYIPAPYSIYRSYRKLEPGSILTIRDPNDALPAPKPYWTAADVASAGMREPVTGSEPEIFEELERRLVESVSLRMVADVPVGVFLSGGIDSSLVTAVMQSISTRPVRTFTIGFNEREYNEAHHARAVAAHLGTEHTELYVSPAETREVIPRLPELYDEPFADSSQIPTFLVSQMARRHVTVSLTGDGGDEFFGGYDRYKYCSDVWRLLRSIPRPLRMAAGGAIRRVPQDIWNPVLAYAAPILPRPLRTRYSADKVQKFVDLLPLTGVDATYLRLISSWSRPSEAVIGGWEPPTALTKSRADGFGDDVIAAMMYLDSVSYLPDDILVKVDRATMGVSLEAREPLLDHRLIEFAWRLPMHMKRRNGVGKWALRQLLIRYVPQSLLERPKMGFGVPIGVWLRGPLREWAEQLLSPARLRAEGFFAPEVIEARWRAHLAGKSDAQGELWSVLMFQAWRERTSS